MFVKFYRSFFKMFFYFLLFIINASRLVISHKNVDNKRIVKISQENKKEIPYERENCNFTFYVNPLKIKLSNVVDTIKNTNKDVVYTLKLTENKKIHIRFTQKLLDIQIEDGIFLDNEKAKKAFIDYALGVNIHSENI
ncbi:hypothetical protein EHP00_1833 [Ecytonucleospora hepatopenaei]|uniref:Uncharacterized protein n=1 Tax=Ecytonucleospora hepatopenaei TaxID=646526 RepID=A0A1W0E2V4_9MICR|nr:hypothetical protein EHP00_1833 [Ecytonucleospora hepatopenaei]